MSSSILGGFYSHAQPLSAPIVEPIMAPAATMSVFDGGNYSARRGYVYAPRDTRDEVRPASRSEMTKRCRYLTRNVGYAKRCVYGMARMVGWLSPVPMTTDSDWNRASAALFERKYGSSPLGFDAQGKWNAYSYQPVITASRLQDSDFFTALTTGPSGSAMVMSYEAHQIDNGNEPGKFMIDGVRVNKLGRRLGYRVLGENDTFTELPARDVIHHVDFLSTNHTRGVSALHHAITNLIDRTEVLADLKTGIKIANRLGMYVVNETAQQRQSTTRAPGGTGRKVVATKAQVSMHDLYSSEKDGARLLELDPGQEIKTLLDSRPHPNNLGFLDYLNRDIAAGLDMSPEVLWNIAALGGASVRFVLADAQKTVERMQQLLVDQFLTRFWVYSMSIEMALGNLPPCNDPNWYVVGWQAPAKYTVDIGRDGKLSIDLHKSGMLTLSRWYGEQGLGWQAEVDQTIEEYAYKVKACKAASERHGFEIKPADVWTELTSRTPPPGADPGIDEMDVEETTPEQLAAA